MKCQNCGINYHDDDKECPMCGTKAGHKGRLSAPRYTGYGHKEGAEPCSHQTYTKKADAAAGRPRVAPMQQAAANRTATTLNGKTVKKKSGKAGGWVAVLIAVLLGVAAPLAESLADHAGNLRNVIQDALGGYGYADTYDYYDDDYYEDDYYDDDYYEGMIDYAMLKGQWQIDRADGGTLRLDVDDSDFYTLRIVSPGGWVYTESGMLSLWEQNQMNVVFDERYPPETYTCYGLYLAAESAGVESGAVPAGLKQHMEDGYMVLLVYHENGTAEDSYILYDYAEENAPMFPVDPEVMVRVQGA